MQERRRHQRLRVSEASFVFSKTHPGRIKDISLGGMAFLHVYDSDEEKEINKVSIFDRDNNFFLENVVCRVVRTSKTKSDTPCSFLQIIQKNVEFSLSPVQTRELEQYLHDNSCGEV